MLKRENIIFIQDLKTKAEVFDLIATSIAKGNEKHKEEIIKGLNNREEQVSTGFEDGFAIPHTPLSFIDEPILSIVKTDGIDWPSMDGKYTTFVICILVPVHSQGEHLKILGNLTRKLVNEEFRNALKSGDKETVYELVNESLDSTKEKNKEVSSSKGKILAVTKCVVGIAHTYMAAESLEKAGKDLGINVKVETQGSSGVDNKITEKDIEEAEYVIISADAAIEGKNRFVGKQVLEVDIKEALEHPKKLFKDVENAPVLEGQREQKTEESTNLLKAVMNGVSHMIPFVVLGGLFIAISLSFGGTPTETGIVIPEDSFWMQINLIGVIGFTLMIPILAGYIAHAIAGRAALAPAMIGAMIANDSTILGTDAGTGFLGALLVGIIAGYIVKWINTWKVKKEIRPIMPIFVIPILTTLIISFVFIFILATPIQFVMTELNTFLTFLSSNPALTIFLGMSLGGMVAFDMGGPVNKVAFLFGVSSIASGNAQIMGAVAAAIAVPPLSMGIATLVSPRKFSEEERGAGIASLLMGLIGITEGAIPFAAGDPKRVIPSIMIGSMVASTLALFFNITNMVPHGGPIVGVLGATSNVFLYLLSILIGSLVAAAVVIILKKDMK